MFINESELPKGAIFIDDLPRMLPIKFRFIWQGGFREEYFLEINQSETRIAFGGSPRKPLGQMDRNLVGSIYGMTSMKIAHFVPIG
jgi:hypothetical protein